MGMGKPVQAQKRLPCFCLAALGTYSVDWGNTAVSMISARWLMFELKVLR